MKNVKISTKNTFNFGTGIWTPGKLILANNLGEEIFCTVTKSEKIKIGEVYVMQLNRYNYGVMNPCSDKAEADRCNGNTSIGRACYKLIAIEIQIDTPKEILLNNINSYVLVKCYPNMEGPGQDGWLIDNDIEGETNKVTIHYSSSRVVTKSV